MENDLFMSMLPTWKSTETFLERNSSSYDEQSPATCFFSPFGDKSPENTLKFESMNSSPVSPPPFVKTPTNEGSLIRQLIGKFDSSPKLGNFNMGLNTRIQNLSGDSSFGSRSFKMNERTSHGASKPPMAAQSLQLEELPNCLQGSSVSSPDKVILKKRKSAVRGKVKEVEDESNSKRVKQSENDSFNKDENRGVCSGDNAEEEKQTEPLKDYIHVRARRGQATDSHSLAERVRREKISERMKMLQDIVPGCNKVTGKALMLDEIINYVQSLQRQVEFLSMKLASVDNSNMGFTAETPLMKNVLFRSEDTAHPVFPLDSPASSFYSQKNPPSNSSNETILPLPLDGLNHHLLSYDNFCENDLHLQTIVNLGFGQTTFTPQNFQGE